MTLSASVSHIKYWITPLSGSSAYLGMWCAVSILIPDKNPAHWGDTVQSVFPLCQADKPNYRGKIPGISPISSLLSTVSYTPRIPQERNSIDFPDSQVWTQNMSRSFVITHLNSHSVTFRVTAIIGYKTIRFACWVRWNLITHLLALKLWSSSTNGCKSLPVVTSMTQLAIY